MHHHMLKLLSLVFLAVYLIIVGLVGMGVSLSFIPHGVVGFIAFVAGVLFLVWGFKACSCDACKKP